jgi:hypothetical protein
MFKKMRRKPGKHNLANFMLGRQGAVERNQEAAAGDLRFA